MTDLKLCPFCGSIPDCGVDFYESHGSEVKLAAVVQCTGCGIYKRVIFKATDPVTHVPFYDFDNAFNEVINEWNRRAGEQDE